VSAQDDERIVTVKVATLKAYDAAVRARYEALVRRMGAVRQYDAAKMELERERLAESDAIDAELAATAALHMEPSK
jgi:hypothetical protein